jgi:hypothetical protein
MCMASNCHNDYSNKKVLEWLETPIQRGNDKFGYCDKFIEDSCQGHTVRYGEVAAVSNVKPQHHLAIPVTIIHLELCRLPPSGDGKWLLLRIHRSIRLNCISQASNRPNILVTSPIARIFLVTSHIARIFLVASPIARIFLVTSQFARIFLVTSAIARIYLVTSPVARICLVTSPVARMCLVTSPVARIL